VIIFILCMNMMSYTQNNQPVNPKMSVEHARQIKVTRQYNPEATQKLQEKMNTFEPNQVDAAYLKDIDQLIKSGANPNVKLKSRSSSETLDLILMIVSIPFAPDNKIDFAAVEAVLMSALENGANVSAVDPEGRTILAYAIEEGSPNMVKLILDHGAKSDPKSNNDTNFVDHLKERIENERESIENMKKSIPKRQQRMDRLQNNLNILMSKK
jgi:hypothetical protein